jgi:replicative DNA helicase
MTKRQNIMSISDIGKIPPQNIDMEMSVLGTMIEYKDAALKMCMRMKPEYFYKDAHQKIFQAILDLINKGRGAVDILTVQEQLKKSDNLESIGGPYYLGEITKNVTTSTNVDIHSMVVTEEYWKRELIRIGNEMYNKGFDDSLDPFEIAEHAEKELREMFDLVNVHKNSFHEALESTITDIQRKAKGETSAYLKTGDKALDSEVSLRRGFVCVIAGAEASGKTKYVTHLARGMLDIKENDLCVLWFTMEDDRKQIIRSFISMDTQLTTKELQSINYSLTQSDITKIDEASHGFFEYDIEFVDRQTDIHHIISQARRFTDERIDKAPLIIIDNLGLVEVEPGFTPIERDDYLTGKIKDLSAELDACIILVHHFNKEASKKANIQEGYRPRKDHIKGSTRILDYVQQALLVNLPRKYKDLIYAEKEKQIIMPKLTKMDEIAFFEHFWPLNPKGDSFTKSLADVPKATWNELLTTVRHKKTLQNKSITAGYILKKYIEYINFINDTNADREKKFHSQKMSIYQFLKKGKYNESFAPEKSSKSYFLYGGKPELKSKIEDLFIVEAVKNRDGGTTDDQVIFRYFGNLNHNIFTEIL